MGNTRQKIALVTGGANGIGDAIVAALANDGIKVFSLDRAAPKQPRGGVVYLDADVSQPEQVAGVFGAIDAAGQGLDIVVHSAGIQRSGVIGKMSFDDWSAVIGTHLTGMFLCASEAMPRMIRQARGGAIISIASTAAFVGLPGRGPYTAAKAGIVGLTRSLAVEAAPFKIRVNAVAPGFTRTAIIDDAIVNGSLQEDWMIERVPLRRLAEPEEIARVVKFLTGDDATYVTGQTIVADGGWTIQGINQAPDWLQPAGAPQ